LADHQGSIIGWTNASGLLGEAPYTYGPYGEPQSWQGSRFRYTGQISLPEAQVYHYKARAYDPAMGHFLQTDPIGQSDDPNLYAYVKGDPRNHADPMGLLDDAICTGSKLGCGSAGGVDGPSSGYAYVGDSRQSDAGASGSGSSSRGGAQLILTSGPSGTPSIGHNGGPPLEEEASALCEDVPLVCAAVVAAGALLSGDTPQHPTDVDAARIGFLRDALQGRITGNVTLPGGLVSSAQADQIGRGFVGPGAVELNGAKGLQSADGLRVYRFPVPKNYGGTVANLEIRTVPRGGFTTNIHIGIK
jgi:RHS repeat-associated protein